MKVVTAARQVPVHNRIGEHRAEVHLVPGTKRVDIYRSNKLDVANRISYGLGKEPLDKPDAIKLVHAIVKRAQDEEFDTLVLDFNQFAKILGDGHYGGRLLAEALLAAGYQFNKYKTIPAEGFPAIDTVYIEQVTDNVKTGVDVGVKIAEARNLSRDWCNTSAKDMMPLTFADCVVKACDQCKTSKLKVTVFHGAQLAEVGAKLLETVGQGSNNPPAMVLIEYWGTKKSEEPIGLVGKGICYDSGGLSLKPNVNMHGMQRDMTGAACTAGTMLALAETGAKINAVAVLMMAENAIGPLAFRPGDIFNSGAGITVENYNSDAEGRLVLVEGITFLAKRFKPSMIIDIATLTGAAHAAVGDDYTAIFTTNRQVENELRDIGERTGDFAHPLPLRQSLHKGLIKSDMADVSSGKLGATHATASGAAMFLQHFATKMGVKQFVHLDMAGVMDIPAGSPLQGRSTGGPVSLLYDAACEF